MGGLKDFMIKHVDMSVWETPEQQALLRKTYGFECADELADTMADEIKKTLEQAERNLLEARVAKLESRQPLACQMCVAQVCSQKCRVFKRDRLSLLAEQIIEQTKKPEG